MHLSETWRQAAGTFTLRQLAGWIFFMQGLGKLVHPDMGMDNLLNFMFLGNEALASKLPEWLLVFTAYFTTYGEIIGGGLLILGLFHRYATVLLAIILIVVTFGHGLQSPIWDLQHVLFRALVLVPLFFLPSSWDRWNLDRLWFRT